MVLRKGLVTRSTGSWYDVRDIADEHVWQCRLKGKFKVLGLKVTNPIAVGDYVKFEIEDEHENFGIISEILPRDNYVIRSSVHKTGHGHLIAANVDQAILIATLVFPKTSLGFIDRFLVAIETFRIPGIIIFNKLDLLSEDIQPILLELMDLYEGLGYQCLATSATESMGLQAFEKLLSGKTSLLSGHSGVGKSTLVNAIAPDLDLRTQEVSTFANKGVHTTTFAEMFELHKGTFIIDSPGIKELGLADMSPEEIAHSFPEMRALLNECRFNNCRHINEPGCAVKEQVMEGGIALSRYESYLSMVGGSDNRK
ncbi:ribosome small subunit-dependent GTPase A [Dyadobacter tibetensis]|uniref:ribosome small subunit-dependent GTPase A n=1 Tax=Dyadobacter tibetensis TaxID=1211851 RepID=UPI0004702E18|nr:ribosome small subunit-dependent GTPase A [Dyadobacter tibetensis]